MMMDYLIQNMVRNVHVNNSLFFKIVCIIKKYFEN